MRFHWRLSIIAGAAFGWSAIFQGPAPAMAQSGSADVMAAFGITQSTVLTQDQIARDIELLAAGYGLHHDADMQSAVANFISALITTVGVTPTGDTQATSLGTMLVSIAASNPGSKPAS